MDRSFRKFIFALILIVVSLGLVVILYHVDNPSLVFLGFIAIAVPSIMFYFNKYGKRH
jgi:uncharacterized membrane protein